MSKNSTCQGLVGFSLVALVDISSYLERGRFGLVWWCLSFPIATKMFLKRLLACSRRLRCRLLHQQMRRCCFLPFLKEIVKNPRKVNHTNIHVLQYFDYQLELCLSPIALSYIACCAKHRWFVYIQVYSVRLFPFFVSFSFCFAGRVLLGWTNSFRGLQTAETAALSHLRSPKMLENLIEASKRQPAASQLLVW